MISTTLPALLAVPALALVAMFALSFYWLAIKDRVTADPSLASSPVTRGDAVQRHTFETDELNEWEACAPSPDHVLHATPFDASRFGTTSEHDSRPWASHTLNVDHHEPFESTSPSSSLGATQPDSELEHQFAHFAPQPSHDAPTPNDAALRCPRCQASRIDTLNIGRKAGGTIGSVAGATSGMAMALSGAEAGAAVGALGGPIGSIFGGLAGAVIASLVGSAAGCAAGSAVGAVIDDNVLDNYQCRSCGHVFGSANG
ncbi:hypothetical protein [Burkholderia pseudomallei]|uniref:hypothetical protein n=1 Tax=Burkholderia pseudomallei TaxID=28450 RepID=UPI001E34F596|nr:hypothetical protein [Burkholderia pseudomallei]